MSSNYAKGLSPYEHKGVCGKQEIFDNDDDLRVKSIQLAHLIKNSHHTVVHTGAGVSTSCGIPDFRGPSGVWTLEKLGKEPDVDVDFDVAVPSFTHLALVALEKAGFVQYLISQNIDGLHLRSGFPRNRMSDMHGNMFVQYCSKCKSDIVTDFPAPTVGLRSTNIPCTIVKSRGVKCRGILRDSILDWEDELPKEHLRLAEEHSKIADLHICLGTSLQIVPCANFPKSSKVENFQLCVVNLQPTKLDKRCNLRIFGYVDKVMGIVMETLAIGVDVYTVPRIVHFSAHPDIVMLKKPKKRRSSSSAKSDTPLKNIFVDASIETEQLKSNLSISPTIACNG